MNFLLIYCYTQKKYALIKEGQLTNSMDCEKLYDFEASELRIAKKILNNLEAQRSKGKSLSHLKLVA